MGKPWKKFMKRERGIRCFFHFEKWGEECRLHRLGPVCLGCIEVDTSCADMSSSGPRSFDLGAESGNNGNGPPRSLPDGRFTLLERESTWAINGLQQFQGAIWCITGAVFYCATLQQWPSEKALARVDTSSRHLRRMVMSLPCLL